MIMYDRNRMNFISFRVLIRETTDIKPFLNETKISEEAQYDGLYVVYTDLLDDDVDKILKVSEGRS